LAISSLCLAICVSFFWFSISRIFVCAVRISVVTLSFWFRSIVPPFWSGNVQLRLHVPFWTCASFRCDFRLPVSASIFWLRNVRPDSDSAIFPNSRRQPRWDRATIGSLSHPVDIRFAHCAISVVCGKRCYGREWVPSPILRLSQTERRSPWSTQWTFAKLISNLWPTIANLQMMITILKETLIIIFILWINNLFPIDRRIFCFIWHHMINFWIDLWTFWKIQNFQLLFCYYYYIRWHSE
jgi:hypothetical protein